MLQKSHKIEVESYQEVYGKISGHGLNPKSHTTKFGMQCCAGACSNRNNPVWVL